MKKSSCLALATLLFVVLGCNLDQFTGKKDDVPTPVPEDTGTTTDTGDTATDTGSTSTDSSPSDEGSSSDISIAKFDKLELGMSYDEAKAIMGSDGNQTSEMKSGSYESSSYEWKGEKFARISVRFQNGELVYRSQSGLTPNDGTADIDQAKFNKINIGMSYEDVKDVIGSEGELQSESRIVKTIATSYRWKGPKYSNIFATFTNDKLQNKSQSGLK